MMRSMFSAISGLRNHMSYMDVVGNNIANVNTTAFKGSRTTFQDILSQNVRGAGAPQEGGRGGTNPAQLGLGMNMGAIGNVMTQGSLQSTGKQTDFAIEGDGFFIVNDGNRESYTRDGAFDIDTGGTLVNPANGMKVQGWNAVNGEVNDQGELDDITVPFGQNLPANATENMSLDGNLNAQEIEYDENDPTAGGRANTTVTAYDALGNGHTIRLEFQKTGDNQWDAVALFDTNDDGELEDIGNVGVSFDETTGELDGGDTLTVNLADPPGGAEALEFDIDLSEMTQFGGASQVTLDDNDGRPAGALVSFSVSNSGEVRGIYSNGAEETIAQLAMATFTNPAGMQREGQNLWSPSANSGNANIGRPGEGSGGTISTGTLEGSNVDLSQQFTDMIMAQRGFQSSSRVITSSDQMLQDLVNIIR